MGTSKGNFGRKMYSSKQFRDKISKSCTYKRAKVVKICPKCSLPFEVERKIDKRGREVGYKKERRYCSRVCANSRVHTKETKKKISDKLSKKVFVTCLCCKQVFIAPRKRKFCGVGCNNAYRIEVSNKKLTAYRKYKKECDFKFAINKFKNKFDFASIEKYGWYKAKNKGDNSNGICRDHIISVYYGFKNNIDPKIISHPANCQLVRHSYNCSKHTKCELTLKQLLHRIKHWDCGAIGSTSDLQSENPSSTLGNSI